MASDANLPARSIIYPILDSDDRRAILDAFMKRKRLVWLTEYGKATR